MNRRVIGQAFGAQRACGMPPIRPIDPAPPLRACGALLGCLGGGNLKMKDERPAKNFSLCDISGLFYEVGKFGIAHRCLPQQKGFQLDPALRRFAVQLDDRPVGAHQARAARYRAKRTKMRPAAQRLRRALRGTPLELDGAQQLGEVGSAAMDDLHLFFILDDIHAGRA